MGIGTVLDGTTASASGVRLVCSARGGNRRGEKIIYKNIAMENKLEKILEYAVARNRGFTFRQKEYSLGKDAPMMQEMRLFRDPEYGLLKAIYGEERPIATAWDIPEFKTVSPKLDKDMRGRLIYDVFQKWKMQARKFSTMSLEDVIDEVFEYVEEKRLASMNEADRSMELLNNGFVANRQ